MNVHRGALRLLVIALVATVASSVLVSKATADRISVAVDVPQGRTKVVTGSQGPSVQIDLPRANWLTDPGLPQLPYRLVEVVLPQDHRVADFNVSFGSTVSLGDASNAAVATALATADGIVGKTDPMVTWSPDGETFPRKRVRYLGTGYMNGYAIASFAVFPVAIANQKFELAEGIELNIITEHSPRTDVIKPIRFREAHSQRVTKRLGHRVSNIDAVASYQFGEVMVPRKASGGFQPTAAPSLDGSPVDYVIVCPDSLAAAYQELCDWKTEKGVRTVIRTVEWITANYRNGVDVQETIRNFVVDAYQKWGITYLLLGGDTEQIPARRARSNFYDGGRDLPVDMYFGCLDGDWNADHDNTFGEADSVDTDQSDLYAEVYVGRLPSTSAADVQVFTDKIKSYTTPYHLDYGQKMLLLAEVLFPLDYPVNPITLNGADLGEFLAATSLTKPDLELDRKYETNWLFPGSLLESRQCTVDSLNAGFNLVTHIGHGFRFVMSVGDASVTNDDADNLTNMDRFFNIYMLNCTALAYEYFCLAEHYLRNPNGGAVSAIGANESAFPNISSFYMNEFHEQLFDNNVTGIGELYHMSREIRTSIAQLGDNGDRWTHYIYAALMDPEMNMWNGPVETMVVAATPSVGLGESTVTATVTSGGSPVANAVVCFSKGNDDYELAVTDGAGMASVDFTAESAGTIKVVATATNKSRAETNVTVNAAAGAYVSFNSTTIDDDMLGGSVGNSDAKVDAGETIDMTLILQNTGGASSGTVDVILRSTSGDAVVVDSTANVGVVGSGGFAAATDPVRVQFASTISDEAAITFDLIVRQGGSPTWNDHVTLVVHRPKLQRVTLRIDDTATGNSDGVVDANEEFDLYYTVKNFGTGAAYGLTAAITDLDNAFVFTDSTSTYPALNPIVQAENQTAFSLREPSIAAANRVLLTITDFFGRVYSDTLEFRPPVPPTTLTINPQLGPDRLFVSWDASVSLDAHRYNVYRSATSGGVFTKVNIDPVDHTMFVDQGLAPSTSYYYKVVTVDASGNQSAQTVEFGGSTNPGQQANWPNSLPSETSSSIAVGDIDGDGDLELVQGSNNIFAWHHTGLELRDGDSDPQTNGVLNLVADTFIAPVALAHIDGVPGLDIVCASRDQREVYVFNYDGDVLPGWPQVTEGRIRAALTVGDINNDGRLEIIVADELGVIYVYNTDGTEFLDGDANPGTHGVFFRLPAGAVLHYSSPALGDLDSDGMKEIVVGSQSDEVYAIDQDATVLPGWPFSTVSDVGSSVAIGDIDNNGDLEVVAFEYSGGVYGINHDGTSKFFQFVSNSLFFGPSPILADIDGNGTLETIVPSSNRSIYVFDHNGNSMPGFPQVYATLLFTESSAIAGDIDGDSSPDIVLGDETQFIDAWKSDGTSVAGFPLGIDDAMRGMPSMADIDLDGDIELVASTWGKSVYVWDFPAPYDPANIEWSGFQGNRHNDGLYGSEYVATGISGASFAYRALDRGLRIEFFLPSEAGYSFDVSRASVVEGVMGEFHTVARNVNMDGANRVIVSDNSAQAGSRYHYRIVSTSDADQSFTGPEVYVPIREASLSQNYPNPFNPTTTINYLVPDGVREQVSLIIYDVRGAKVRTLVSEAQVAGRYAVKWNGLNDNGNRVGSGMYFYRFQAGKFTQTRKMLMLK